MKRTFMGLLAILAVALVPGARVVAEEITFASHSEIMSVLERQNARIAELEAQLHNGGGGCCNTGCCDSCCDSCCSSCCNTCCCDPCCRPAGVIGGAELLFLKPHNSAGIAGVNTDFEYDYEFAHRVWAGFQGSDGLGARIRYFEFNHTVSGPDAVVAGNTDSINYDTYVIDLEFVDSMSLGCYWDASWYGGFRYVEFDQEAATRNAANVITDGRAQDWSGYGLTVGGELRRCIGNGLAGFVNTRGSVIMADENDEVVVGGAFVRPPAGGDFEFDNVYYIWEAQMGAQATRELQMGGYAFARAAFEVQIWDNAAQGVDGGVVTDADWCLGGVSFSAGIIR
jgi:hypothetical protein